MAFNNEGSNNMSDYSYNSDSDSDSDPFFSGYSVPLRKRVVSDFISLPMLRTQYSPDMPMDKKILLFLYAIDENDIQFAETLLLEGVPIDSVGRDGWPAIMKASLNGLDEAVRFLLDNGSNPNFQAGFYNSLMASCTYSSSTTEQAKLACVELLLQHNADVNMRDRHKTTALMHAASSGYATIIERLLMVEDLNPEEEDFDGWNAIFHAVSNNRIKCVQVLVENGLNYKKKDNFGRTPLLFAEQRCFNKLASFLSDLEEKKVVSEEEEREYEKKNPYVHYLKELPDARGNGGFPSDTEQILSQYGVKLTRKIPFPDFLNMREKDLMLAGVKIRDKRKCILSKVIHRYHRCPWSKSSLVPLLPKSPMGLENAICILGGIAKHLTLMRASLRYFNTRIENRKKRVPPSLQADSVKILASIYDSCECIETKLKNILQLAKKVKHPGRDDLIKPKNKSISKFKCGLVTLGAIAGGYLIFNYRLKIDSFIKGLILIRK